METVSAFFYQFVNVQRVRVRHPESAGPFVGIWLYDEPNGEHVVFASSSVARLLDVPQESDVP